jgi:hypothetical protein
MVSLLNKRVFTVRYYLKLAQLIQLLQVHEASSKPDNSSTHSYGLVFPDKSHVQFSLRSQQIVQQLKKL